jgi:hypothetical protein
LISTNGGEFIAGLLELATAAQMRVNLYCFLLFTIVPVR